jgi:hypothetical protein
VLNAGTAALAFAFLFLVVLLVGIVPGSTWSWRAKLGAAAALVALAAVSFVSFPELLGWPSDRPPPAKFRLLAVHVQQPDKQTRDQGSVYLWTIDARHMARDAEPRAYRAPYSAPLHEAAAAAATKLGKGIAQLGEFSGLQPTAGAGATAALKFYDVPDPLRPEG